MTTSAARQKANIPEGVLTISAYISLVNERLRGLEAKIIGEVTQVSIASSGHVYFTLKDKEDGSVLRCAIWKSKYAMCGIQLKEGLEIIASGYPNVYAPRGDLTFIANTIELFGEGALKDAYEKLKKKLEGEGIFAPARKRQLPEYPQIIGVVTSREGAVIHDFESNLGKYGFKIKFVHSQVEGQQSVLYLLRAIKTIRKHDIDVLVIIRGGGSMESLQGFNNESLVREIVSFPVPVVAGIGHDKDVPLVALAADIMVSTPTAAANLLSEPWREADLLVEEYTRNIFDVYEKASAEAVDIIYQSVRSFKHAFTKIRIRLRNEWDLMYARFHSMLESAAQNLQYAERVLRSNDPSRQLRLGYSIARHKGRILKSVRGVSIGNDITIQFSDGVLDSKVKTINKKQYAKRKIKGAKS